MRNGNHKGTAVVTGAAGGLGECFARKLAAEGYALLLTDRCGERIEQLRDELAAAHDVEVETFAADLSNGEALQSLARRLLEISDLELLVNNAGFATVGHFADVDADLQQDMIHVHVMAPACLTRAVLPGMLRRDCGAIVNVSSLGAWLPIADHVQYASTKSYLIVFSKALREELLGTKVRLQVLCPGFIKSGFHESQTMIDFDKSKVPAWLWNSPEKVVDYSLKSLSRNRLVAIPGWRNRLLGSILQMLLLRPLVRMVLRRQTGNRVVPAGNPQDREISAGLGREAQKART